MPNLVPPITTVKQALDYRSKLQALEPDVEFLMSLYLHESMTVETIQNDARAGITGVKSYPAGVTTNSSSGVVDYAFYYPIFAQMEKEKMVLNLHGEHVTTAEAVETVKNLGENVAATISAHHLHLIVDDWAGNAINYCKPVAKTVADRAALLRAAASGNPKFFFGSDSAPHPVASKRGGDKVAAGVFTQPYTTQLVIDALERGVEMGVLREEDVTLEKLKGFMSEYGRNFYGLGKESKESIELTKGNEKITDIVESEDGSVQVVPFRRGESTRSLAWVR